MRLSLNQIAAAIILGILPLTMLPRLPGSGEMRAMITLAAMLLMFRIPALTWVALAMAAFVWGCVAGSQLLTQTEQLAMSNLKVDARIISVNSQDPPANRVLIKILRVRGERLFPPAYAWVSWKKPPSAWCGGQAWSLTLKLRPQHSRLNEGGFDSQRHAIANHQMLTGRVIRARLTQADCGLRQRMVLSAVEQQKGLRWSSILMALAFGESRELPQPVRLLLQQTGTAHLMAISGLHISLAALFGWLIARAGQLLLPSRWLHAAMPLVISWMTAVAYVWVSGANFPALRALLALSIWITLRMRGIHCDACQVWLWCVAMILVSDPLSVLSTSLWLSCLAVGALLFWFRWAPLPVSMQHGGRWAPLRWLHLQAGMSLLLLPLQWGLFQGANALSLPANLWAVPLVSFITTPLVLSALCLGSLPLISRCCWWLADLSLTGVMVPLEPLQQGWMGLGKAGLIISIGGWLLVIMLRFGWWKRYPLNTLVIILLLLNGRERSDRVRWRAHMLDVGHGLAMVIESNHRAIIYDTGAGWQGGNIGKAEIMPFISWRGLRPDAIVLSHSHLDHIGGLNALKQAWPWVPVSSSYRAAGHEPCLRGQQWQWQGLTFSVLWPKALVQRAANDDSCVIAVTDGKYRLLLTGDIEARAERALLKLDRAALQADILQVPHHGSKTSSTQQFLRAVGPRAALSSAARFSPWRLPAPKIRERYEKAGINWHDTALSGQITVAFYDDFIEVKGYRQQISERWFHQWFGVKGVNG